MFRMQNSSVKLSEKMLHISDMTQTVLNLKNAILDRIEKGAKKEVWSPRDFLDLGRRDVTDKTLQRLAQAGRLRRISRGLYDKPSYNKLMQKDNPPDTRKIIDAIARRDQIRVLVDGMTAANDLGLTNAVPAKVIVHTDARIKPIVLGNMKITFKPTAPSKLYWANRPAMRVVQALHWLRDMMGRDDNDAIFNRRLKDILSHPKYGKSIRDDLRAGFLTLPSWMQDMLRPMLNEEDST